MELEIVEEKAVAVVEPPTVTKDEVIEWLRTTGKVNNLQDNEIEMFIRACVTNGLDPFKREIHISAYGSGQYRTLSIVTGYEVYIRKAEQSKLLEFWDIEEPPLGTPLADYAVTLKIKRRDKKTLQHWTVYYEEAVQKKKDGTVNAFWQKQPRMMTKKVAMSQGFRLFFEDVLQGIPYTAEEMPSEEKDVTPAVKQPTELPSESPSEPAEAVSEDSTALNDARDKMIALINSGDLSALSPEEQGKVAQEVFKATSIEMLRELYRSSMELIGGSK